MSIIILS